jgi:hypothetical protein
VHAEPQKDEVSGGRSENAIVLYRRSIGGKQIESNRPSLLIGRQKLRRVHHAQRLPVVVSQGLQPAMQKCRQPMHMAGEIAIQNLLEAPPHRETRAAADDGHAVEGRLHELPQMLEDTILDEQNASGCPEALQQRKHNEVRLELREVELV